jgi:AcrR family transcriptional regulator
MNRAASLAGQNVGAAEEDGTRKNLKAAAMRLFSLHGIDGVSTRDIIKAAGARNTASLHYYFGTKETLIRELVIDAAKRSDRARKLELDRLERSAAPFSVADIVRMIVEVETIGTGDSEQISAPPIGFGHMRFVSAMQLNHRDLFMDAIGNRWNASYLRCLTYFRALLPQIPEATLNQRLVFFYVFLNASLAAREAAFDADPTGGSLWGDPSALPNLIRVLAAGIEAAGSV